jgi:hypothetical protein
VDVSSPPASESTSSSAWSSPHLDYTHGGDVPPLLPSVLGTAAPLSGRGGSSSSYHRSIKRNNANRYSISSSSASSSGTCLTDEEDVDSTTWVGTHDDYHHYPENPFLPSEHKFVTAPSQRDFFSKPSRLSYARCPSATNNRPTVTSFHRRSGDSAHSQMTSRSASSTAYSPPLHPPSSSAQESSGPLRRLLTTGHGAPHSHPHPSSTKLLLERREARPEDKHDHDKDKDKTAKPRRTRNRASLPAYFSLLQIGTSSPPTTAAAIADTHNSPHSPSSSSGVRLSPPTPRMTPMRVLSGPVLEPMLTTSVIYASGSSNLDTPIAAVETTPRGRRREPDASSRHRSRLTESRSRSRSRSSRGRDRSSRRTFETTTTTVKRGSVEQVFDWSVVAPVRGRPARRNSSPMAKGKLASTLCLDNDTVAAVAAKVADDRQQQGERRGRYKPEELARYTDPNAPGLGYGRSGLLNRSSRTRGMR